jgi:DNA polymerase-1
MSKEILYLVDGTSLCYRSFFALKLSTSSGLSVGAVYGFYRTLKKITSKYNPDYLGICFDVSRKTFRQDKFNKYKINRPPLPDDLKVQIPLVKRLVTSLGIRIIEQKGFEADDLIASLCRKALKDNLGVVIASSDKDLCQLIEPGKVRIYNYNKDKFITSDDFFKEYGFGPQLMADYLALAGDSTDNIPGAKGIGKIGAAKLIKEFGSVENIFKSLDKIPVKTRDILTADKKMVLLSKELAQLSQPQLDLKCQDLKVKEPDSKELYNLFRELEFKALLENIPAPSLDLGLKVKEQIPREALKRLCGEEFVFFGQDQKVFIFDRDKQCIYAGSASDFREVLEDESVKKVSYGFKSQLVSLTGPEMKGLRFDVKIAAYLLEPALPDYALSALVSHYLGEHTSRIPAQSAPYFISGLYRLLSAKLKEEGLDKLFFEVEMPLIPVLAGMQKQGVNINPAALKNLLAKVDKRSADLKSKIFKIAGKEFNLNSPKQLAAVLFDDLGIAPLKKTKTGYSTNEEVLDKLSSQYPIAGLILEYRYLNKLKTTYIVPLAEEVGKNKGKLHTQFNQTGAQTGRLSSSSPNLQSIPVKGEFSQGLREAFIPSYKDGYILSGDYSQIEPRILAHLSGDENLIKAFSRDLDIHSFTATLLFEVEMDQVSTLQRSIAKRVNFGIVYGMSAYGLSKELKISPVEAQNFIDDYFSRYSKVREYLDRTVLKAEKEGFVTTILGRRRKLPDINSSNLQLREFARRQAINAPIQGSCADLIKVAMVSIGRELTKRGLKSKLIIQIHDELVFDVAPGELKELEVLAKRHMEDAIKLTVPVKVNLKAGQNWGTMKDVGV